MGVPIWRPKSPAPKVKRPQGPGGLHPDFVEWAERRGIPGFLLEDFSLQRRHSIRRRFPRRIRAHDNLHNIAENLYPQGSDSNSNDSNSTNDYAETREQLTSLIPRLYSNVDLPSLVRSGRNSPPPPPPPPPPEMSPEDETPARLMWSSSWATDDMVRSPRSGGGRFSMRLPLAREMPPEEYDIPLVLPHQRSAGPSRDSYMEPLVPPPPRSISQNITLATDTMMPGRDRTASSLSRPQVHFTNPPVAGTIPRESGSLLEEIERSRSLQQSNSTYHNSGNRSSPPRLNAYRQGQAQALRISREEHAQRLQRQQQATPQFTDPNIAPLPLSASRDEQLIPMTPTTSSTAEAEVDPSFSAASGAPSSVSVVSGSRPAAAAAAATTAPQSLASLTEPPASVRFNASLNHQSSDNQNGTSLGTVSSSRPTEESVIFLARQYWNSPFNRMLSGSDGHEHAWSQMPTAASASASASTVAEDGGANSLAVQGDEVEARSNHRDHHDRESRLEHQFQHQHRHQHQHQLLARGPSLMASIRAYSETPHNPGNIPDCPRR